LHALVVLSHLWRRVSRTTWYSLLQHQNGGRKSKNYPYSDAVSESTQLTSIGGFHVLSTTEARGLTLPPKTQHLAFQVARERQHSERLQEDYKRRAGIEGTMSQIAFA
jgi:hypothetical protein